MTSTRSIIFAGIVGMALGIYVGTVMQRSPAPRQLRMTGLNLLNRARGVVQDGVSAWMD